MTPRKRKPSDRLIEIMLERFDVVLEAVKQLKHEVHHMGLALDNLKREADRNNVLVQQAVDLLAAGGTVNGEDPVAVQAVADQLKQADDALAAVLAVKTVR